MNTNEWNLKVQAKLDGELSAAELAAVEAQLLREPEGQRLLAELVTTRDVLAVGEPELKLPDGREFYWSKIQRRIEAEERAAVRTAAPARHGAAWWLRFAVPVASVALLMTLALPITKSRLGVARAISFLGHEIESPLEETSTISFYYQADAMTVVWVQNVDN